MAFLQPTRRYVATILFSALFSLPPTPRPHRIRGATRTLGKLACPIAPRRGGSTLAIAYKTNARAACPKDFAVFSAKYDSSTRQLETFNAPDLPACPDDRCRCAWIWIHKSIGRTDQMVRTTIAVRG